MTRVLVVDNYDSFTGMLVDALRVDGASVEVRRNDEIEADWIDGFDGVLLSPGPGTPARAGATPAIVGRAAERGTPLLGVCLGHQAIGEHWGARLARWAPVHGKPARVRHDGTGLFAGLPTPTAMTCYNSLGLEDVPDPLLVTAMDDGGRVMGLRHRDLPVDGVQFHPESVGSELGPRLLANWLRSLENSART